MDESQNNQNDFNCQRLGEMLPEFFAELEKKMTSEQVNEFFEECGIDRE